MNDLTISVLERLSVSAATRDDWMTLLDSPILNKFPETRDLAIEKLSFILDQQASGTEKVLLGRKYQVSHWLRTGLRELLKQDAPWSDEDEATLGWPTVSKLYRVREAHYKQKLLQLNGQLQRYRRNDVFHPLYGRPNGHGSISTPICKFFVWHSIFKFNEQQLELDI